MRQRTTSPAVYVVPVATKTALTRASAPCAVRDWTTQPNRSPVRMTASNDDRAYNDSVTFGSIAVGSTRRSEQRAQVSAPGASLVSGCGWLVRVRRPGLGAETET